MAFEIFYEDLIENFSNNNLREKLMFLVNKHKIILIKGLSSELRHKVYRQMHYPLKFEKIIINDNNEESTDIRIYNCKIKLTTLNKKNDKNITKVEKTEGTNKDDQYVLQDSEEDSSSNSEYDSESSDSYLTEEDEQLTKLEDIGSQILERVVNCNNTIDKAINRINLVIMFNMIGWIMFYSLDPIRLVNVSTNECDIF